MSFKKVSREEYLQRFKVKRVYYIHYSNNKIILHSDDMSVNHFKNRTVGAKIIFPTIYWYYEVHPELWPEFADQEVKLLEEYIVYKYHQSDIELFYYLIPKDQYLEVRAKEQDMKINQFLVNDYAN